MPTIKEQIDSFERTQSLFWYILDESPIVSAGLERRIIMLLAETDDCELENREIQLQRMIDLVPRIRLELCEVFATNLIVEIASAIDGINRDSFEIEFKTEFPVEIYTALCFVEDYSWRIQQDDKSWKFSGFTSDMNDMKFGLDWRDVFLEGGVPESVLEALQSIGFGSRLVDCKGNNIKTLTANEIELRPLGAEIEPLIAAALLRLPQSESNYTRALVDSGIDPAFIFAFQKTRVLVTQEKSPAMNDTILRAWDNAVVEYRAIVLSYPERR